MTENGDVMKTKEEFLARAVKEKMAGNAACGTRDPYPHDVAASVAMEAFFALGGTDEELQKAYAVVGVIAEARSVVNWAFDGDDINEIRRRLSEALANYDKHA